MPIVDPYRVLGVKPGAEYAQIHKAYRRLARRHHPDTTHDAGPEQAEASRRRMAAVNGAWAILSDPGRRKAYDSEAAAPQAAPGYVPQSGGGPGSFRPSADDTLFEGLDEDDLYEPRRPRDLMVMIPVLLVVGAVALFALSTITGSHRLWMMALVTAPVAGVGFVAAPLMMMRRSRR